MRRERHSRRQDAVSEIGSMPWSTDQRVCRSTRRGPGRDRQTSCEGARLGERRCSGRACGSRRFERPGRCRWRRTAAGVPRASRTARVLARGRASRAGRGLLRGSRGQPPRFVWSVDQGSPAVCHVSAVCAADPTAPLHHVDPADGQKTPVFPPGQVGVESLLHQLPGPATGLPVVLERVLEQRARSRVLRVPLAALAALGHSAAAANRSPARSAGGSPIGARASSALAAVSRSGIRSLTRHYRRARHEVLPGASNP